MPVRYPSEQLLLGEAASVLPKQPCDVPLFAELLFPRPCVLTGEQGKGFEWTANLYKTLGSEASFHQVETNAESVMAKLP